MHIVADPDALTTSLCLHAYYPRILLMLDQGVRHGPQRVCTLYIHGLCQRSGCDCANQFYVSFGLDNRYLILIVTKCYRDI